MTKLHDYQNDKEELFEDVSKTIGTARNRIYYNIQKEMLLSYWQIGKMIVEKLSEKELVGHSDEFLNELSAQMSKDFGKTFTKRNLEQMRRFYLSFQNPNTLCAELSWSHYQLLLKLDDESMRTFYLNKAIKERWSVRQLEKEIRADSYQNHQVNRDIERVSKTPTYKFSKKSPFN